ncbi:hypothetical protein RJ639_034727 [Escallonia herrerae]|uniref:Uncharacterized protein n=1 Tax=Escallonia herrerae TaxID=1293975 RepID=A0AA89BGB3_9ASTE|nr:hypothetical protein RJ639_034727 [Escallonia herrerae]
MSTAVTTTAAAAGATTNHNARYSITNRRQKYLPATFYAASSYQLRKIRCSNDSNSKPRRGFGSKDTKGKNSTTVREEKGGVLRQRTSTSQRSGSVPSQAPGLGPRTEAKSRKNSIDVEFEERLEAVRRSAAGQKKVEENKELGAIDYDAPIESEGSTTGIGTKIGVGVAVVVFGLVFALGDFLPSGSVSPSEEATMVNKISGEEKANLQTRLQQYEATLTISPEDPIALEGAAVTLAELGEYSRAATLLEDLTKKNPSDADALRLLGEVKYELKDYEGSVAAYKRSAMVSKTVDFDVLSGLTNALLAAKKPDEVCHFADEIKLLADTFLAAFLVSVMQLLMLSSAVQVLLASRHQLDIRKSNGGNLVADGSVSVTDSVVDPIQVELLLGKAYSDWGHVSDAVSVYDQLISSHPDDFRGYLAKGIILKENGKFGDAERMFIQARFFAPEKAKALVERYAKR